MRRYEVILDRVMVPYHERDLARTIAMQVLDARLGGPQGVVDAHAACIAITGGDPRWPIPDTASRSDCAAVKRWRRATEAALDAIERGFAQIFNGLTAEEIELARADEHLTIVPLGDDGATTSRLLDDARIGLPWTATAAVLMATVSNVALSAPR
ncbi:hypothetical protein [Roseateles amylovorans]|uniref:Uncharacterized protein n=1 Tax=Roseateles amylovorans TaxID=2978473 RepID=A0ABY6AU99_9BURK|nr:hypothetical protein [Roseateles amylovorans]UXH76360.1 hypothetical protein N4261_14970 [Roseateles amylovorans]